MVHEHKAAALPCVVGCVRWANGRGREQGTSSRVWAASELRHSAHCLAQACGASRAASASSRATSATPQHRSLARSERYCACDKRCAQRWRASCLLCVRRALRPAMVSSVLVATCDERCAQRWRAACLLRRATSAAPSDGEQRACCDERWRAPCDGEQQRCDAAHGLRAHGQRWLCACGPWACDG